MASRADHTQPTATELAELSALADGTLDPARRAEVQARDPGLAGADRAVRARAHASSTLCTRCARPSAPRRGCGRGSRLSAPSRRTRPAPAIRVRRRCRRGARRRRARRSYWSLPSGTPGGPSVSQTRQRWPLAGRRRPRPVPDPDDARADGSTRASARSTSRTGPRDSAGNAVGAAHRHSSAASPRSRSTTSGKDTTIAYTIVHAPPLAAAVGEGDRLATAPSCARSTLNGRQVVTWRRDGDTCVLSGDRRHGRPSCRALAAWQGPRADRMTRPRARGDALTGAVKPRRDRRLADL